MKGHYQELLGKLLIIKDAAIRAVIEVWKIEAFNDTILELCRALNNEIDKCFLKLPEKGDLGKEQLWKYHTSISDFNSA